MLDFDKILLELGFGKYQIFCAVVGFFFSLSAQMQFLYVPFLQNCIANEFKVKKYELLYLSSFEYFGYLLGSIASGYAGDYFGRKKLILVSSFSNTVFLALLANVGSYQAFVFVRFFCGFCTIFSFLNSYVLFFETIDLNNRGKVSNLIDLFISFGAIVFIFYMWLFLNDFNSGNWRFLTYFTSLHSFIYLISTFFILDESVRFDLIKKNYKNAFKTINRIAKRNKNIDNYIDEDKNKNLIEWTNNFLTSWNFKISKRNCCEWLFFKELKKITPILWLIFFTVTFTTFQMYYTIPFTLIQLNKKQNTKNNILQLIYVFLAEIPSPLITMAIIDKRYFGRINSLSLFLFVLFVLFSVIALEIFNFLLLISIARSFCRMCFALKYVLICDFYPTIIRTMGLGVCSAIGRFGMIIMPFVVIFLLRIFMYLPYIASGVLCLITACLIHFLPESASIPLDQLFQEEKRPEADENFPSSPY